MSKSQITNFKLQISNVKTRIGNWTLPAGRQELEIINSVRGFTLIELLIIFAISSIVIGISVNSFNSYNNSQIYNQSLSDVQNFLVTARSRAISQLKPAGCGVTPLDGFEVSLTVPGQDYVQNAVCGATRILIERKKLPSQISFVSGSASSILFDVGTGTVTTPGTIALTGFGKTYTISVNKIGIASVNAGLSITPVPPTPTPTTTVPTPTPTGSAPTPTPTPTPTTAVASTSVSITSITESSGVVYFNVSVGGTNCSPYIGVVYIYKEGPVFVTQNQVSNSNPATSTPLNSAAKVGIGPHTFFARYIPNSGTCPTNDSANVNFTVN